MLAAFTAILLLCVWYALTHEQDAKPTVLYACVVYETGEPCAE